MKSLLPNPSKRKLLDQVRDVIRPKHYNDRPAQSYIAWIRRYILFYNKRHPKDMGSLEVEAFLTCLAVAENVFASGAIAATSPLQRYVFNGLYMTRAST